MENSRIENSKLITNCIITAVSSVIKLSGQHLYEEKNYQKIYIKGTRWKTFYAIYRMKLNEVLLYLAAVDCVDV